jgi:multicomponent Na+:H+ antiporter subunit G
MLNILVGVFLLGSIFFFFVGTLGLLRLPDALTRLHATTKCDTLGAGFAFIALILHYGFNMVTLKLFIIIVFIWIINPTAGHAIGQAVYEKKEVSGIFKEEGMN